MKRRHGTVKPEFVCWRNGETLHELFQDIERIGVEDHEVPSVEEARIAGQLILLAEDNPTNQDVIGRQLNRLGYQFEVADDGEVHVGLELLERDSVSFQMLCQLL